MRDIQVYYQYPDICGYILIGYIWGKILEKLSFVIQCNFVRVLCSVFNQVMHVGVVDVAIRPAVLIATVYK
jgi:hypothetical protein